MSQTNESYYPLNAALSLDLFPSNISNGSISTGFGYALRGAVERRLDHHLVLGTIVW